MGWTTHVPEAGERPATVRPVALPPFRATVERDGDRLVVSWEGDEPVAVHVSSSPDEPGAVHPPPPVAGRLELDDLDPGTRYYVHLVRDAASPAARGAPADTVVVAERLVPLAGTLNFRDIGGYPAADGRRVRWGSVFRSDHLGGLVEDDIERLDRLGVRTVVDFQGAHERADAPRPVLPEGMRRVDRPIIDGPADGVTFYDRVMQGEITRFDAADLATFYLRTLERSAAVFGEVLALIADPGAHAVVFHCRAGKDRTGLTAALLLGALGVSDEDILDDYELTNRFRSEVRIEVLRPELREHGIDIDDFLALFLAQRASLEGALTGLRRRHGSIEGYLREAAGLDDAVLADLRRHLLT
jgi:protein-tyrosine phosphatase